MELGGGIAIAGGSVSLAALIVAFIQWSLKRNVAHEDRSKEELTQRVTALEAARSAAQLKDAELEGQLRNTTGTLGEIRGVLHELRGSLDASREKQADFYRAELEKLSQGFRQELSRHVHPDLPERVTKLESKLEALVPPKRGRTR